jgi:hypothetical protein
VRTLAAAFLLLFLSVAAGRAADPDHVVIIFIDGPRYAETFGDPSRIPRLWNDLRPEGAILTAYRNGGLTVTCPGHATTLCGRTQLLANDGSELPHDPTLFERHRAQNGGDGLDTWVVAGKAKLHILAHSDHPDYGAPYAASAAVGTGGDVATVEQLLTILDAHAPRITAVNLPDVDVSGHSLDWERYLSAITRADSLIGAVWDHIQASPTMAGRTMLVVTADHGRHDNRPEEPHDGFQNHGDGCDGCRHLPLLAVGAGVRAGEVVTSLHSQVDLAATLAHVLDLGGPGMEGFPIHQMLSFPTAVTPVGEAARILEVLPHPFRAGGAIRLERPRAGSYALRIFDSRGRLVRGLHEGAGPAGRIQLRWNGRDGEGRPVASGVYHLHLEDGPTSDHRTLVLIR